MGVSIWRQERFSLLAGRVRPGSADKFAHAHHAEQDREHNAADQDGQAEDQRRVTPNGFAGILQPLLESGSDRGSELDQVIGDLRDEFVVAEQRDQSRRVVASEFVDGEGRRGTHCTAPATMRI